MKFAFRRDIALGRYVALDTPVHRLDPRTKLLAFLALLAALFGTGLMGLAVVAACLLGAALAARLPLSRLVAGIAALRWILAITFAYQLLWAGPTRLGGMGEGALAGLHMALRLVAMLLAAYLLTFTTEPVRLADGVGRMFGFLERVKVPVRDLALVLTLALRFLPTVLEEAERIVLAQQARGARFEGGPVARARRLLPLAVPLFAGCLHRADLLALAMEARGFQGSAGRTQMDPPSFAARDALAVALLLAVVGAVLALRGG